VASDREDRWGSADEGRDRWDDDRGRGRPLGGDPVVGRQKVKGAGTVLMVYGIFSLLLALVALGLYFGSPDTVAKPYHDMMKDMTKDVPKQPGQPDPVPPYDEFKQQMVLQGGIGSVIAALCSLVTTIGGMRMRAASNRGLAMTGAILGMIPCTNSCCLIGLPVGIWALVVLSNPDVKAAFAETAAGGPARDDLDRDRGYGRG
jgi:hypothetical protein